MSERRRIALVTGSRAEWGLLRALANRLRDDDRTEPLVVATGSHFAGSVHSAAEITADGHRLAGAVPLVLDDDSRPGTVRAMAEALRGVGEVLARLAPDIVVVLGDRYEILAVASAALVLGLPLAHLHGGEVTEGAMDESIRHAVTKMASLHFVAAEPYRARVVQMGEAPERVFVVGAMALDSLAAVGAMTAADVDACLGMPLTRPLFLVTCHPETRAAHPGAAAGDGAAVNAMLDALDSIPGARVVITGVNADPGHRAIADRLQAFAAGRPGRVRLVTSLGQRRYLGLMRQSDAVVGNSSSGLLEAPYFHVPTVNIGDRQRGRLRAASVLDVPPDTAAIAAALRQALDPAFRASCAAAPFPFGHGSPAAQVAQILATVDVRALSRKPFHDRPLA